MESVTVTLAIWENARKLFMLARKAWTTTSITEINRIILQYKINLPPSFPSVCKPQTHVSTCVTGLPPWYFVAPWLALQLAAVAAVPRCNVCRTSSLGESFSLQLYIDVFRTRGLEFGKVSKIWVPLLYTLWPTTLWIFLFSDPAISRTLSLATPCHPIHHHHSLLTSREVATVSLLPANNRWPSQRDSYFIVLSHLLSSLS